MAYQLLSLFSGAGGMDLGFEAAGFEVVVALDNCPFAVRTYNHNHGGKLISKRKDISRLTADGFLDFVPDTASPIGLIGGPPCQGFSRANVTGARADPRNRLLSKFARLLSAANERYQLHFFVFENVVGLARKKHAARLAQVMNLLTQAGFRVFQAELDAADFGVPQRRRRLFLVGLNSHRYPAFDYKFPVGNKNFVSVADSIAGLPTPSFFSPDLRPEDIAFHPNHWTMVPRSVKFRTSTPWSGRSFKRLDWDSISPTVAYGNREIHIHPSGRRRLTIYEAMRLQGFPHEYQLVGTFSSQTTQISNAVPPPIAEAIAQTLLHAISNRHQANRSSLLKCKRRRRIATSS